MPSLYTEITINQPRSKVWQILIQKEKWLYWNTFLYDRDPNRPLEEGREVFLSVRRVPGDEETEFQPKVTLLQPNICLRWKTSILGFTNEHIFELQDLGRDRTQYIHQETFSGNLTRIIYPFIRQDEQKGLRRMAQELKYQAES